MPLKNFCQTYVVKDKTRFKNPINPTCIDLVITNRPESCRKLVVWFSQNEFNGHEEFKKSFERQSYKI